MGQIAETIDYPLNADSVVFDVGGYRGLWSAEIAERYDPYITIFEPIKEFYEILVERFKDNPKIHIHNVGLSDHSFIATASKSEDGTSLYLDGGNNAKEEIQIVDIEGFDRKLDLISINCEGGEYALLNRMLKIGMVKRCEYIQIQFHHNLPLLPNTKSLQLSIQEKLQNTHTKFYDIGMWESWKKRS